MAQVENRLGWAVLEDNVMPLHSAPVASEFGRVDGRSGDRLPVGVCVAVWAALSATGWGLIGLALYLL